jgi:hypoxanthine phosphoribosyltransferase
MTTRRFISEEDLLNDAFKLGVQIYNSGFRPSFVVGLWRGGSSVGIYVQECLQYLGVETDHIAIRTSYSGVADYPQMAANPKTRIRVHGTQYLLESLNADDRLLLVDDVFSSGQTFDVVTSRLKQRLKRNMPENTKTATIWARSGDNSNARRPDYFLHETDSWLVLPYELSGLSSDEIEKNKPLVADLLRNQES